jgi:hypothetical protein
MNAEAFTLKARRTTRVPLRVPVKIGVMEGDQFKSVDGSTVIVNIHGAKVECKRKMAVNETVQLTVSRTGNSQSGQVVWSTDAPTAAGNFEFAVELTEPGNLWGVGFPPLDWKEVRAYAGPSIVETPMNTGADASVSQAVASENPSIPIPAKKIAVVGYEPKPITPFAIEKAVPTDVVPTAPVAAVELVTAYEAPVLDVPAQHATSVELQCSTHEATFPEMPLVAESLGLQNELDSVCDPEVAAPESIDSAPAEPSAAQQECVSARSVEETAAATSTATELLFAAIPEAVASAKLDSPSLESVQPQLEPAESLQAISTAPEAALDPGEAEVSRTELEVATPIAEAQPAPIAEVSSQAGPLHTETTTVTPLALPENTLGVLVAAAETDLHGKIESLIERTNARLEAKLAEMEAATLERAGARLNGMAEDHYERLDQHSESFMAARRIDFEQALTRFSEATDEAARERQQEMVSRMDQDLRHRANELALYTQGQLQGHAIEAAENAQSAMAGKLQDLLTTIDGEVAQKCRSQAEQIHLINRAQFESMLSSRIEEARAYWQCQMDEMQESACRSITAALEGYVDMQGKKLMQQMDQSLAQMARQIQKTFFKHVVAELSSQQQAWMTQFHGEINTISEQNMHRVRQQFVQVLGVMGEALIRREQQAYPVCTSASQTPGTMEAPDFVNVEA